MPPLLRMSVFCAIFCLLTSHKADAQDYWRSKKLIGEPKIRAANDSVKNNSITRRDSLGKGWDDGQQPKMDRGRTGVLYPAHDPKGKDTKGVSSLQRLDISVPEESSSLSVSPSGSAGTEISMPLIIHPSPNASSLMKAVEDNIDLYTGQLNVSIPLHTVKSQNVQVPISLSYSGGGHRVNDIGSWVGLGWSLNAGGAITRVVRNLPDEYRSTTGLSSGISIEAYGFLHMKAEGVNVASFYSLSNTRRRQVIDYANWHNLDGLCWDYGGACPKAYDVQPDEFYFRFGGYSGKFVFDQDGNVQIISKQNLKFTKTIQTVNGFSKIVGFTVVTEDGYSYEFGGFDRNAVEETSILQQTLTSRYDYPYIGTYNGTGLFPGETAFAYERIARINKTQEHPNGGNIVNDDFQNPNNMRGVFFNFVPTSWYLTKVTSPQGGDVNLTYADNGVLSYVQNRTFSASVPDLLDIIANSGTTNAQIIFISRTPPKKEYSWDRNSHPLLQTLNLTYDLLALKSKRLVAISNSSGERIEFTANRRRPELAGDKNLDDIKVYSNNTVVKTFKLQYESFYNNEPQDEVGIYQDEQGVWHTRSLGDEEGDKYRTFLTAVQEIGADGSSIPPYRFLYNTDKALPKRMSVHQDKYGFANLNHFYHPMPGLSYFNSKYNFSETAYVPYVKYSITSPDIPIVSWNIWRNNTIYNIGGNHSSQLEWMKAGALLKMVYPTGGYKEFSYSISGHNTSGSGTSWNGLKVDQVDEVDDPLKGSLVTTRYTYENFSATDVAYFSLAQRKWRGDDMITFSSDRVNPAMLTRGAAGGYGKVTVTQTGNGRIEYTFYNATDFSDITIPAKIDYPQFTGVQPNIFFPPSPKTSMDWKRGLVKKEAVYNNTGNPVQETEYGYGFAPGVVPEVRVPNMASDVYTYTSSSGEDKYFSSQITEYISAWAPVTTKKVTLTTPVGNSVNTEAYTYNSRQLLAEKTATESKGLAVMTKYRYPFDFTYPHSGVERKNTVSKAITAMPGLNMLNYPIETVRYVNGKVTGAFMQTYRVESTGKIQPYQSFALETGVPLALSSYISPAFGDPNNYGTEYLALIPDSKMKLRMTRERHDPKGNILTVSNEQPSGYDMLGNTTGGQKGTGEERGYVWNYRGQCVIAEAKNAAANEIYHANFEDNFGWQPSMSFSTERFRTGLSSGKIVNPSTTSEKVAHATISTADAPNETGYRWLDIALTAPRKFTYSVWVYSDGPEAELFLFMRDAAGKSTNAYFTRVEAVTNTERGKWVLLEGEAEVPAHMVQLGLRLDNNSAANGGQTVWFDDVRLHPSKAQMTTYTYNPLVGMSSATDANGRSTYYEYDGFGRVTLVKDDQGNLLKEYKYHYKR